jgi:uncharacterized protein
MMCDYCYTKTDLGYGTYGEPSLMAEDVAYQAVDFLFQNSRSKNLEIVFFGGEPLINFDLIRKVVDHANLESEKKSRTVNFQIVTNATLLSEEVIRFVTENKVFVQVSLDGKKEVNDKHRIFLDGKGSHNSIVNTIKNLLDSCSELVSVRAVITRDGVKCFDTIKYFLDLGFQNIHFTPVYTTDPKINLRMDDMKLVKEELEKYAKAFLESALEWRLLNDGQFLDVLKIIHQARHDRVFHRTSFCGAGKSLLGISVEGDIYPCHSFIGLSEYNLGNVFRGISEKKLGNYHSTIDARLRGKCSKCWAKRLCGGGCAYAALAMNNCVTVPYDVLCFFLKTIYRLATDNYNKIHDIDPDIIEFLFKYPSSKPLIDEFMQIIEGKGE